MRKPDLSEIEAAARHAAQRRRLAGLRAPARTRQTWRTFPQALNYHRRHGGSVTIGHGGLNLMREMLRRAAAHPGPSSDCAGRRAEAGTRTCRRPTNTSASTPTARRPIRTMSAAQPGRRRGVTVRDDCMAATSSRPRCLVLGGAGFLGGHIVEALLDKAEAFVSSIAIPDPRGRCRRPLTSNGTRATSATGAMSQPRGGLRRRVPPGGDDLPKASNDDPVHDLESNLLPTVRFLDAAVRHGVKKVVFASSGGTVYGIPRRADRPRIIRRSRCARTASTSSRSSSICTCTTRCTGCEYCVLRLANPFGERQRSDASQGAVAVFLDKALRGEEITVWGDGSVVRDYVYVGDVARAFCLAAALPADRPASSTSARAQGTASRVARADRGPARRGPCPGATSRAGRSTCPSTCSTSGWRTETLGWRPRFTFRQGLERTLEWIQKTARAPS